MKILITGCAGMLGEAIYKEFKNEIILATDINLNESWFKYLDVRDYNKIEEKVKEFKPDYIFHLASLTDLEYQEKNPQEAYKTILLGTINIALICKKYNIKLIHISTAGVFDGTKKEYKENSKPNPLNDYGKAKTLAENFIKDTLKKYYIIRPCWMVGGYSKDKKFVSKILKQIREKKKTIYAIKNLHGVPTYTYDFAKTLKELIKTDKYGIYHIVCKGKKVSRYDIAKEIVSIINPKIKVKEVDVSFFAKDYPVLRPNSEALIDTKLKKLNQMRDWKVSLREYLSKWKE